MELKFELTSGNLIEVSDVFINDEGPFKFIIDTGARVTSIPAELAEKLGLETYNSASPYSKDLKLVHKAARLERLKVGSEVFEDEEILVLDLTICCGAGVIGHTTLKHFKMSVDYDEKVVRLERPSEVSQDDDVDWIPLIYVDGSHLFEVPVTINDTGPHTFVMDTGAGGSAMDLETATSLGLSVKPVPGLIVRGLYGDNQGSQTVVENVTIGHIDRESFPFITLPMNAVCGCGGTNSIARNGIIGFDFLKGVELVIDYPGERYAFIEKREDN
ncbi:MAG: aspartyl protease family protein [Candidatus Thorarchaeota archaeon]|nr:MAG: aspartyl protease family protein [Candidatus Thorarchaeota archaeon]